MHANSDGADRKKWRLFTLSLKEENQVSIARVDGFPGCFFKKFDAINFGSREKASAAAALEYKKQAANRRPNGKEGRRIYFAVAEGKGKVAGIFLKKEDCDMHVNCSFPVYKSFVSLQEAAGFITSYLKQKEADLKKLCPVKSERVSDLHKLPTKFFKWPFHVDYEDFVQVYVDGSCFENGKNGAKAGLGVFFGPDHAMNISKAVQSDSKQSNNSGELQAVKEALRVAKQCGIKKLKIHSDSQYVIKCFTYWVKSWQAKGWMTSASTPVKNQKVIQEICDIWSSENIQIKWNYVRAHRGIRGNEAADRLAKNGAKRAVRVIPY
uniref:Ribonuclease H1 n=1 Tax=Daphnia galeata TaxID=27404 RepID=A0A8J2VZ18_9CRUS|nr:unnamed protein product [Daphnia galeata]